MLKYHLAKCRFMYLWHVLHTDKSELIRKVYDSQKFKPNKGDWVKIIEDEKSNFDIQLSDDEIVTMSKGKYENMIKKENKNPCNPTTEECRLDSFQIYLHC